MAKSQLENLPLDWVRAFETAARLGSFTAAAQETGLTQAAISQRIAQLEARLGTQLFIRQARGVVLSVEGEAWLPYVSHGLATLDHSARELFGMRRRTLKVSASASMLTHWIAPRLAGLSLGDDVQISCQTYVLSAEDAREAPMVRVRYGDGNRDERFKARLFTEVLSPVCAPKLLGQGAWQTQPRLSISGPREGWREWSALTGDASTPVPRLRFDTFTAGLSAARAGAGVLLASLPLIKEDLAAGNLLRLSKAELMPNESYWMYAPDRVVSRAQWAQLSQAFCEEK